MRKINSAKYFIIFVFSFVSTFKVGLNEASAAFITITKEGSTLVNVLAVETDGGSLKIVNEDSGAKFDNAKVSLSKENGKMLLSVLSATGGKEFDVSGVTDEILQIEERPTVERLSISVVNGAFSLNQGDIKAVTDYQIEIDPKNAKLALATPTGYKFLSILPRQAVTSLIRSGVATMHSKGDEVRISEDEDGNLYYLVQAEKVIPILNVYDYTFPVEAKVSAVGGEILSIEKPSWMRLLGFLFV
ncbi:hypothetical protein A3A76_01000 [Candidatus Woesebacteria bacterium RIFCSPLOWO2_01_FULL_39_23]|uniref:Uncharacterized protein n=1 Tax=Candidatus Woesebacteria bacterium RIFCSPHIGHO2_01_FULL_40_22 TaxID=1802499 RepID=A0A1F7YIV3_9BACT|nr:MAG: hypothetical protein A2141_05645 [Candidatus Woesebacteria bacterium RBG_16_40_11]OGM26819.1 MAG: hypothetical protein A2628_04675 [Candidatus Woesebacteria bacterium RIFCSPHIGHO2_01_FULL_40_22]OGM63116.1 MAG: hypothetical protein A3A76_01000 [Candidatus Woesebacteria bacterium RIFCSPLOWO2_01_FULL_39_23]